VIIIRYKTITLANNRAICYVDEEDYSKLMEYKWRVTYNKHDDTCYATTTLYNRETKTKHDVKMHRMIMGVSSKSTVVDHINSNGCDNRKSNLRVCSIAENSKNKSTVRFNGITYDVIIFGLKVDTYDTRNDATKVWHELMFRRYGKFYKNNFRNLKEAN